MGSHVGQLGHIPHPLNAGSDGSQLVLGCATASEQASLLLPTNNPLPLISNPPPSP